MNTAQGLPVLWDLLFEHPLKFPVDLLVQLLHEVERIERTIDDIDADRAPHAPGTKWLGQRYNAILCHAMLGKPINDDDITELFESIKCHREYWLTNRGVDPYAANRAHSVELLQRMLDTPDRRPDDDRRRILLACHGLLAASIMSPGACAAGTPRRLARLLAPNG